MGSLDQERTSFQIQTDATLTQVTPAQNTWYTILQVTGSEARILFIAIEVDTTGETLQVQLTIDGVVYNAGTIAATAGQYYSASLQGPNGANATPYFDFNNSVGYNTLAHCGSIEGRSIKVEMRKTTAAGAGTFHGRVMYAQVT